MTEVRRVVIVGAAGRDFHNFNVVYRQDPNARVVAFTAAQIHGIAGRRYPASLAGPHHPEGIPIVAEDELEAVCRKHQVTEVAFSYSDVTHQTVMHLGSRALALGADFVLLGPGRTMLASGKPVIAISAARTGCGKSQTARHVAKLVRDRGLSLVVVRHPMPYGDLAEERVQRFATLADLTAAKCTAEEREEYEPHIEAGNIVFAGVDYGDILRAAEAEADVIVWDGGNNDIPFYRPDLHIGVVDALRPAHVDTHHPGETVVRMADVIVVSKTNVATPEAIQAAIEAIRRIRPHVPVVRAASPVRLDRSVAGLRAVAVDDGPTLTHGGMAFGAGLTAAREGGALIVDPKPYAPAALAAELAAYPHLGPVLPALGYDAAQLADLESALGATPADVVVSGTPIDLAALVKVDKPIIRARYDYADAGEPVLSDFVDRFLTEKASSRR